MGSMLEFGPLSGEVTLRLYVSRRHAARRRPGEIPQRYRDIDAAVLHLGGTRLPGGLMVTMDARQDADCLELIDPGMAVPVHFDDYALFTSPLSDFRAEVTRRGLAGRVTFVDRGDTVTLERRTAAAGR